LEEEPAGFSRALQRGGADVGHPGGDLRSGGGFSVRAAASNELVGLQVPPPAGAEHEVRDVLPRLPQAKGATVLRLQKLRRQRSGAAVRQGAAVE